MQPRRGRRRKTTIDGQWVYHRTKMIESYPWRQLSLSAHRVLDRIEIEHSHHGGFENGNLPVTYGDFEEYGIDRHSIAPALRELVALGFVEITQQGCGGNADFHIPNKYRLTYLPTKMHDPTDEWKLIQSRERALNKAKQARDATSKVKKQKAGVENQHRSSVENPHLGPVWKTHTPVPPEKSTLLSISPYRGGASRRGDLATRLDHATPLKRRRLTKLGNN
jgi:hypothetical protein